MKKEKNPVERRLIYNLLRFGIDFDLLLNAALGVKIY